MNIKRVVTTGLTYLMIFVSSGLIVQYLYEFFYTDISSMQSPARYLTKYMFCIWIFLFCMKESTLIDGKKATYKTCYPPRHPAQYIAHGLGLLKGLIDVVEQIAA